MYYRENGILVENPIWYNVINGSLIVNLRKLKLIFNKGEEGEEIIEFVINDVVETHTDGQLKCEVTAEGLAFQELGKVGYKISLASKDFIDEYSAWAESDKTTAEPKNNINYWCNKIFNKNSHWKYSIQMDWSSFDGIITTDEVDNDSRENSGLRRTDKIYEEEYISSWEHIPAIDGNDSLIPRTMENFKEKLRLIDLEKSNIYNLTQDLAKAFGVYCKYKYYYDENYHIIGRECIFYNNFLSEKEGKIDIIYPYSVSKIEREIESADVVTKMFVTPIEDNTSPSGLITIADVAANKTREDYILNFDYLYKIGTISQEQYDAIEDYNRSMFIKNTEIEPLTLRLAGLRTDLVKYEAQLVTAQNSQILDKEQMDQASTLINSVTKGTGVLHKNLDNPYRGVLLESKEVAGKYYIKITQEGVDISGEIKYPLKGGEENTSGIYIYYYKTTADALNKELVEYASQLSQNDSKNIEFKLDENGNLISLANIELPFDAYSKNFVLTFAYKPELYYQNIYNTYAKKLAEDEISEKEASQKIAQIKEKIKKIEDKYDSLLKEKQSLVADFENMMGPALREGSWQAENYSDYGSKYNQIVERNTVNNSHINFYWDEEPFEEEQLLYYYTGAELTKNYYPCIDISENLSDLKDYLKTISFIYPSGIGSIEEQMSIGSEMQFAFIKDNGEIKPVLLLTKKTFNLTNEIKEKGYLGVITSTIDGEISIQKIVEGNNIKWQNDNESTVIVYPRLKVDSLLLKVSDEELVIKVGKETLKNYYDYFVLIREGNYFITFKEEVMLRGGIIQETFDVSYALSNAALSLYLDALEVSKTNAFPQVSYSLDVSAMNTNFIKYIYQKLNYIVNITDNELKFENVQGYISELELDLDNPWKDNITIQNYKTKFEDLFSTIVASTEQMKTNSFAYSNAANAFGPNGALKPSTIQNAISQVDLTYAFQGGNLTIDEINGIWARSDAGVVAIRGGGIFCATQTDNNGNWLWNTGIMPSGINASLITAGQLDTNLIKIYAGNNLRLQLNADGLFAYNKDSFGEADLNQYVVHNSDGLFLVQPEKNLEGEKLSSLINKVEISWDGLILRNDWGEKVFFADDKGNLTISGHIETKTGSIGPWEIRETGLWSESEGTTLSAGLICAPQTDDEGKPIEEYYKMFWIKGIEKNNKIHEFYVMNDGTLFCDNVIVSGFIRSDSFIGATSGDEINQTLRNISLTYDGARFSFNNRNYDGNLIIDPSIRYLFVETNALTLEELKKKEDSNSTDNYSFYYNSHIDENGNYIEEDENTKESNWKQIDYNAENSPIIWKPESLTFVLKSDIMKQDKENPEIPLQSIYFKIEKEGRLRGINEENGEVILSDAPYIYSSIVQFFSEYYGINKHLSLMSPSTYTFISDKNLGIQYEDSTVFSVEMTGFTMEEASKGYWLINEGEEIFEYSKTENITNKIQISLSSIENKIIASITIPQDKIPEGGSIKITFKIDQASREAYCFKTKNGSDGINIVIRSSSGNILTSGDTETELSAEVYYGAQLMNGIDSNEKFYYVWKKDGVALSEAKEKIVIEDNSSGENIIIEKYNSITRPEIFSKNKICVQMEDFGIKSDYSCHIFTLDGEELSSDVIEEYLLNNSWGDQNWPPSFYISEQPKNVIVQKGEFAKTQVVVVGENLTYQWYYRNLGMKTFGKSGITQPTYSVLMDDAHSERYGRQVYCIITGDFINSKGEVIKKSLQSNIVTLNIVNE